MPTVVGCLQLNCVNVCWRNLLPNYRLLCYVSQSSWLSLRKFLAEKKEEIRSMFAVALIPVSRYGKRHQSVCILINIRLEKLGTHRHENKPSTTENWDVMEMAEIRRVCCLTFFGMIYNTKFDDCVGFPIKEYILLDWYAIKSIIITIQLYCHTKQEKSQ